MFWPDAVSLCDARLFDLGVAHRHLTDVRLLALAVRPRAGHLVVVDA